MDEPFGAVDPIVRARLQRELLDLQEKVRKTIVLVTHDIDEAVALGDKVAVLNVGGVLEQYDTPDALLAAPANDFVASFLGAERSIKRLALTRVRDLDLTEDMWADVALGLEGVRAAMAHSPAGWLGLVRDGRFTGWVSDDDLAKVDLARRSRARASGRPGPPGQHPARSAGDHPDLAQRRVRRRGRRRTLLAVLWSWRPSGGGWPDEPPTSRARRRARRPRGVHGLGQGAHRRAVHGDPGHQPDRPLGVGVPAGGHPHRALGRHRAAPQAHLHRGGRGHHPLGGARRDRTAPSVDAHADHRRHRLPLHHPERGPLRRAALAVRQLRGGRGRPGQLHAARAGSEHGGRHRGRAGVGDRRRGRPRPDAARVASSRWSCRWPSR